MMSPLADIPESGRSATDPEDRVPEPAEGCRSAPWPEDEPRRCEDCGLNDVTTRRRINRPHKPALCTGCFIGEEE
jgi:hypothetical protein